MKMILFQTDFSVLWVFIIAALVFGGLAWLEFKRKQKLFPARLIALFIAIIALLGLILQPAIRQQKTSDYIILTKNYNPKTLDSLIDVYPASQRYQLSNEAAVTGTTRIKNYRDLRALKGNIHLLGDGIPQYMLDYLDTTAFHYYPSPTAAGFTNLAWRKKYTQHQVNTIEGVFYAGGKSFTLTLKGGAVTEDSIQLTGKASHTFALKFTPKTSGKFTYTLSVTDSVGEIIYTERVPVVVIEQQPLSILILSDYPTAEIRFLKNYLEAEKHELTLRYTISKNKFRTEFINTAKKSSVSLNSNSLAEYDLIIVDGVALTSLSENQLREIKQATLTGLGVLVLLDAPIPTKTSNFLDIKPTAFKSDTASLRIHTGLLKIPAAAVRLSSAQKITSVLTEISGRTVAGYQHHGLGKIGFQLLTNTYQLQLAGEKETYAEIWSAVLAQTARPAREDHSLSIRTSFPVYEDEPVAFDIISATQKPIVKLDSLQLPLIENTLVSNVWHTQAWAGHPGWHVITINNTPHALFVSNPDEWNSLRLSNQQQELKKLSRAQLALHSSIHQVLHHPLNPLIFYLIFLFSAGFLWIAPKL